MQAALKRWLDHCATRGFSLAASLLLGIRSAAVAEEQGVTLAQELDFPLYAHLHIVGGGRNPDVRRHVR